MSHTTDSHDTTAGTKPKTTIIIAPYITELVTLDLTEPIDLNKEGNWIKHYSDCKRCVDAINSYLKLKVEVENKGESFTTDQPECTCLKIGKKHYSLCEIYSNILTREEKVELAYSAKQGYSYIIRRIFASHISTYREYLRCGNERVIRYTEIPRKLPDFLDIEKNNLPNKKKKSIPSDLTADKEKSTIKDTEVEKLDIASGGVPEGEKKTKPDTVIPKSREDKKPLPESPTTTPPSSPHIPVGPIIPPLPIPPVVPATDYKMEIDTPVTDAERTAILTDWVDATKIKEYMKHLKESIKDLMARLPIFCGDKSRTGMNISSNIDDHINSFERWLTLANPPRNDVSQFEYIKKMLLKLSLESKALNKWIILNLDDVKMVYTDCKKKLKTIFSTYGETCDEQAQKWENYVWNIHTQTVSELIEDVRKLGVSLGFPKEIIAAKLKSLLPAQYKMNMIGITDLDIIEARAKEIAAHFATKGPSADLAAAQTPQPQTAEYPFLMSLQHSHQVESKPKEKRVSFEEEEIPDKVKLMINKVEKSVDKLSDSVSSKINNLEEHSLKLTNRFSDTLFLLGQNAMKNGSDNRPSRSVEKKKPQYGNRSPSPFNKNNQKPGSRDSSKDRGCDSCGQQGHFYKDCFKFQNLLRRYLSYKTNTPKQDLMNLSQQELADLLKDVENNDSN